MDIEYLLLGDFGGTHTQLRYVKKVGTLKEIIFEKKYENKNFKKVEDILTHFVSNFDFRKNSIGIFGIARSIDGDRIEIFNNDFVLDKKKVIKLLDLNSLDFINDLQALAYGVLSLRNRDYMKLFDEKKVSLNSPIGIVSIGTGIGKSILYKGERVSFATQSAGGHVDFQYRLDEIIIVQGLMSLLKVNNIVYEDILSGMGLESLYQIFYSLDENNSKSLAKKLSAKEISDSTKNNKYSKQTTDYFSKILGRFIRNFAMEILPFNGIYLGGGILQKNGIYNLKEFEKEFYFKNEDGKIKERLKQTPIYLIKYYNSSLDGLYNYYIMK